VSRVKIPRIQCTRVRFNKLIPEISVTDIEDSLRFYTKILGRASLLLNSDKNRF